MAPWSVGVRSFARQELTCLIRRRLLIVPRLGTGAKAPAMQHLLGAFLRHPRKARSTFFRVGRLPPLQNPSPKKAMPDLVLKRSRIVLNEVYDVVSEGRVVGRISLSAGPAPSWLWILAYRFHEGRSPTRGQEATVDAAMQAFAKAWHGEGRGHGTSAPQAPGVGHLN
jgi:hypothetical protein